MSEVELISPKVKAYMEHWLQRYPADKKRSAVVEMLLQLQDENGGSLTQGHMQVTADFLDLSPIQVYEIATFYDMYELSLIGKHKIAVCTNVSCMLAGSDAVVDRLKQRLGVGLGETTKDGQFTLREVECLAACVNAPVCQINNKEYIENLTVEKVDALIDQLSESNNHD